jgi:hypothetical protein
MERVVGIFFFALMIVGLVVLLCAKSKVHPEARRKWSVLGIVIESFALFFFGSVSLVNVAAGSASWEI